MKAIRHVPVTESLSFGWKKTWENLGFIVSFFVVAFLAQIALGIAQGVGVSAMGQTENMASLGVLIFSILRAVINVVFAMAGINATLQMVVGKKPSISSAFEGVTKTQLIVNYALMSVIVSVAVALGLIFFVIPGIYFMLKFLFSGYVLVDKKAKFSEALSKSGQITAGVKWELVAFAFVSGLVNLLGMLAFGVGLLITVPMTEIARGYIYRHLSKTA